MTQAEFIAECRRIADDWGKATHCPFKAASGAIFTLLVMLDGESERNLFNPVLLVDLNSGRAINDDGPLHDDFAPPKAGRRRHKEQTG